MHKAPLQKGSWVGWFLNELKMSALICLSSVKDNLHKAEQGWIVTKPRQQPALSRRSIRLVANPCTPTESVQNKLTSIKWKELHWILVLKRKHTVQFSIFAEGDLKELIFSHFMLETYKVLQFFTELFSIIDDCLPCQLALWCLLFFHF